MISNSHTYDNVTYTINDPEGEMNITYAFGLDMESIEIPAQLEDLTYMLPGADAGSTAWDFLLQLAERVSVLTEVRVEAQFSPELDVDVSGMTVSNDFFEMYSAELDENNKLTIVCKWIDQTQAIDPSTANPICVLSGIKAKPKADVAWTEAEKLPIVNQGEVSYKIYLRANALYSFALEEKNQQKYGLYPFDNTDVIINGSTEKGAYFGSSYATFKDSFILDKQLRQGWYNFDSQLFYFVDHVALTGVQKVPGFEDPSVELFYLFDENGGSQGTITGLFEYQGNKYYAVLGELMTGWRSVFNDSGKSDYYYFDASGKAVDGVQKINGRTYTFENNILVLGEIVTDSTGSRYYWAGAPMIGQWVDIGENTYYCTYPKGYFATGMIYVLTPEGDRYERYLFDSDGVFRKDLNGLYHVGKDTYYAENGMIVGEPGLVYLDGYYYYFCSTGKAVKNCNYWISVTNNLLPQGYFHFDEQGRMTNPPEIDPNEPLPELENGIVDVGGTLYYYINGQIGYGAGIVQLLDGGIIYVRSNGQLAIGDYWPTNTNCLLPTGVKYTFGADGRMVNPPTIYYTITWVVEGVETSVELAHSAMPVYNNGVDPTKAPDEDNCYEFIGWNPDVVPVVSDATYTATFMVKAHSGQTTTVDATCTEPGSITVVCGHCGTVMSEEIIPATGHINTTTETVEPTCTEPGSVTVTCACGEVVSTETIEATGHVNTTTTTVEATCTENGTVTVTCDACGEVLSTEVIESTGHDYTYTNNGENHTVVCSNGCGYSATEDHTYVNGSCVCGAEEVIVPAEPTEVTVKISHTVSFDSDLKMNYRIKYTDIAAAVPNYTMDGAYLTVEKDRYPMGGGAKTVETVSLEPDLVSDDKRVLFSLPGIQSVEMGSELRAVLHFFDTDGNEYYTTVDAYSVLAYAQLCFDFYDPTVDAYLFTMLIDCLNYGSAAQVAFDRRADELVNAGLEAYQQYATTELSAELTDVRTYVDNDRSITAVTKMGFSVTFADKTEINAKMTIADGYTKTDITSVKVLNEAGKEVAVLTEFTELDDGRLQVTFTGMKSVDMRNMYYFVAYVGDQVASQNVGYSIEAYAKSNIASTDANAANLARACIYYGDSAKIYFDSLIK